MRGIQTLISRLEAELAQLNKKCISDLADTVSGREYLEDVVSGACFDREVIPLCLLVLSGLDPNFYLRSSTRYTPLMQASRCNLTVVQLLLAFGADPNIADSSGWTALMFAVAVDQVDGACSLSDTLSIIGLLRRFGADMNATNRDGHTALDIASMQRYAPSQDLMLVKQALHD